MSRQILTRFDPHKKICSSTTKNRLVCDNLYVCKTSLSIHLKRLKKVETGQYYKDQTRWATKLYLVPGFLISMPSQVPSANSAGPMYRTTPSSPFTRTLRPYNKNEPHHSFIARLNSLQYLKKCMMQNKSQINSGLVGDFSKAFEIENLYDIKGQKSDCNTHKIFLTNRGELELRWSFAFW